MNQLQELRTLYAKVRAGHDPDTKQLHISEEEFVTTLLSLITEAETKARNKAIDDVKLRGYGYDDGTGFVLTISFADLAALKETHEE